jgi:hypothetical protein
LQLLAAKVLKKNDICKKNGKNLHISKSFCIFAVDLEKICETMKAKWTSIVDDLQGSVDSRHYARHIPGNGEWAAVCQKPELSKKTKKKKASLPHVKEFGALIATCKEILHDPERRAAWQAKYDEAKRKACKYNKPIQGRLCDYVRHEVSVALKKGEEIA